jgi:hypothetical protein
MRSDYDVTQTVAAGDRQEHGIRESESCVDQIMCLERREKKSGMNIERRFRKSGE